MVEEPNHPHGQAETDEDAPLRNHEDLREILRANPADEPALLELSAGLFRSLCRGLGAKDPVRRRERIDELADLSTRFGHPSVLAFYAMGLYNAIVDSHAAGDRSARDAYMDRLRTAPGGESGRRHFAMALHNAVAWGFAEAGIGAVDRSLGELRALAAKASGDDTVRLCLAQALVRAAADAGAAGDGPRHDELYGEARRLADS